MMAQGPSPPPPGAAITPRLRSAAWVGCDKFILYRPGFLGQLGHASLFEAIFEMLSSVPLGLAAQYRARRRGGHSTQVTRAACSATRNVRCSLPLPRLPGTHLDS